MLLLGIDAGNHWGKTVGASGTDIFRTAICEWFERNVEEKHGHDDMEFEIGDRKGFAGTIATLEDDFGSTGMYGDSKAHSDTKIRVLLAIHRYLTKYHLDNTDISIVTGQPIISHKATEKDEIRNMLTGPHKFIVDGTVRDIHIHSVNVSPEGASAYRACPQSGVVRIIDIGSGTINCAMINNGKFINNASTTFNFGMETVNNKSLAAVARGIIRNTTKLKWGKNDTVLICGGSAALVLSYLTEHFPRAELLQPNLEIGEKTILLEPVFANAAGMYDLAMYADKKRQRV